jgi:hypothetical protein
MKDLTQSIEALTQQMLLEDLAEFVTLVGEAGLAGERGFRFGISYRRPKDSFMGSGQSVEFNRLIKVGIVSPENEEMYEFFAGTEKINRLRNNHMLFGHMTSYESMNLEAEFELASGKKVKGSYGGAIIAQVAFDNSSDLILSCSAYRQLTDEAFACFVGLKHGWLTREQFGLIKERRTDNPSLNLL